MDLDFSFALVSSLTPRSKVSKTPISENKLSSKLKSKATLSVPPKLITNKQAQTNNKEDKENIPTEQLMKKHGGDKYLEGDKDLEQDRASFAINMANVAVRKKHIGGRRKLKSSPLEIKHDFETEIEDKNVINGLSNGDFFTNVVSKGDNTDAFINSRFRTIRKGVKRISPRLNKLSTDSISDFVVSPSSEVKNMSSECSDSSLLKPLVKRSSPRISGISEGSLSTAYDSDSIRSTRRRAAKAIPETPDSDQSFSKPINKEVKSPLKSVLSKKSSFRSSLISSNSSTDMKYMTCNNSVFTNSINPEFTLKTELEPKKKLRSSKDTSVSDMFKLESSIENQPISTVIKKNFKEMTDLSHDRKDKRKLSTSPILKEINSKDLNDKTFEHIKGKRLRNREHTNGVLENKPEEMNLHNTTLDYENNQVVQEKEFKYFKKAAVNQRDSSPENRKLRKSAETTSIAADIDVEGYNFKKQKFIIKDDNSPRESPKYFTRSPNNNTFIPPSEVIPKFEHISNWLKDTEEKSIISLSSDHNSSFESPETRFKKTQNFRKWSPLNNPKPKRRIKTKKGKSDREKEIPEGKRNDDLETRFNNPDPYSAENLSIASSQEAIELSEKVLEKLYGTFWRKSVVLPHSEPRKGKQKGPKKAIPSTERKKPRTSIYDVFSSSSSEDRFEEFLENVRRGKFESTRRQSRRSRRSRSGENKFINDSSSECETSFTFYQNLVSSGVKKDVEEVLIRRKEDAVSLSSSPKINRRRLSFSSSKDGCSESGKSDKKPSVKPNQNKTIKDNKRNPKTRSKKKIEVNKDSGEKQYDLNVDGFTLVTPIKIKGKPKDKLSDKIRKAIDPTEVPTNVSRSKTPKNPLKKDVDLDTDEKLRAKYLGDNDFKIPKNVNSLKTPTRSIKSRVPGSPSPALSFLSSLSEVTGGLPCHPDALIYKKDFKKTREELTKKLFTLYNKEVFDSQLPPDMLIQWNTRMTSTSGYCYNKRSYSQNQIFRSSRIVLSTKILDRADRLRDTLIHELCHAATWIIDGTSDGHGPKWRAWADQANRRFPELPVIKRCHDYAISTKFTYKCMTCGYCIGRHTKSLNTARKRCGYCYGEFQVFVTAKMATQGSDQASGSDSLKQPTPRNPSGFALFVKENYANVKKENNVPHGQVMKLLSQKFAEVKISKQKANGN